MSSKATQLKVFKEMLNDLKEQVLSEMQSLSPDDEKIANLAVQIDSLDARIRNMAFNDEEKENINNNFHGFCLFPLMIKIQYKIGSATK